MPHGKLANGNAMALQGQVRESVSPYISEICMKSSLQNYLIHIYMIPFIYLKQYINKLKTLKEL